MKMDSLFEKELHLEQLWPLMEEYLKAGKTVKFSPKGVSMLPMLRQGKDKVELSPLPSKLKKYDLPVYQYPSGKYVMHRVVDVKDDYYICNGDNLLQMETVYPHQLIAVVSAFTRNGKRIEVTNPLYMMYCRFWCGIRPFRHFLKKIRVLLSNTKRKVATLINRKKR